MLGVFRMVAEDFKQACDVINNTYNNPYDSNPNYSRIYFQSNESLKDLFRCFSVEGKDVLTVLGSSDHLFHALANGAKSVDTFDINHLTKYYYYLPKSIFQNHDFIFELLKLVTCETKQEEEAYQFWSYFIEMVFPVDSGGLFYVGSSNNTVEDVPFLRERLQDYSFHFTQEDLFEGMSSDKKYDVIITSNILEYSGRGHIKLLKGRNHLYDLLKEDGIVIGSHYFHSGEDAYFIDEIDAFRHYFKYKEFPWYQEDRNHKRMPLGYSYTKIDVNKK